MTPASPANAITHNPMHPDDELNIETIMQEIRREILAQRAAGGSDLASQIPLGGRRLPPDFYDHLYQAGLAINDMQIRLHVTRSGIPLLGPLIDRLRQALHQVVLFYVHKAVERQAEVNRHLLHALSSLSEALEAEHDGTEPPAQE